MLKNVYTHAIIIATLEGRCELHPFYRWENMLREAQKLSQSYKLKGHGSANEPSIKLTPDACSDQDSC